MSTILMTQEELRAHCLGLSPIEVRLGPEREAFLIGVPTLGQLADFDEATRAELDTTNLWLVLAMRAWAFLRSNAGCAAKYGSAEGMMDQLTMSDWPELHRLIKHFVPYTKTGFMDFADDMEDDPPDSEPDGNEESDDSPFPAGAVVDVDGAVSGAKAGSEPDGVPAEQPP